MASDASKELQAAGGTHSSSMPKHKQLVRMLSFRVVPAYYREIEKVANHQKVTVSKLIRSYIKEGMKRDNELSNAEDQEFRVD